MAEYFRLKYVMRKCLVASASRLQSSGTVVDARVSVFDRSSFVAGLVTLSVPLGDGPDRRSGGP